MPDLSTLLIVCPLVFLGGFVDSIAGGGGLITGVSTLAKMLNPNIKVIGVEPAGAACMKESLKNGKVTTLPVV